MIKKKLIKFIHRFEPMAIRILSYEMKKDSKGNEFFDVSMEIKSSHPYAEEIEVREKRKVTINKKNFQAWLMESEGMVLN